MSDLIERQKAIDEIMKELKDRSLHDDEETSEDFADGYDEGIRNAATRVYLMPSAQPEIIRCKECKHHWIHRCMDSMPTEICDLNQTFYDPYIDFCSLAERRTDGSN